MSNIDRKMVTVRKVSSLAPIQGADLIEVAHVDGWQCVVKKGEFQVGDSCLYFEIDSCLPADDKRFAFLKDTKLFRGERRPVLKTVKLRGQLSQGLALPLSMFPEISKHRKWWDFLGIKDTVELLYDFQAPLDKILRVDKYEKEEPVKEPSWLSKFRFIPKSWKVWFFNQVYRKVKHGRLKSSFPDFIPRTDEPRIQNCYDALRAGPDHEYEVSYKLDGSSMTFWTHEGKFGFASRNQKLGLGDGSNWEKVVLKHRLHTEFFSYCMEKGLSYAAQGELLGPGIQGNFEKQEDFDFFLFNIYDIAAKRYLTPPERNSFLEEYNAVTQSFIKHVPIRGVFKLSQFKTLEELLASADGPGMATTFREGDVWKSLDGAVSFKVISNRYLLKKKE